MKEEHKNVSVLQGFRQDFLHTKEGKLMIQQKLNEAYKERRASQTRLIMLEKKAALLPEGEDKEWVKFQCERQRAEIERKIKNERKFEFLLKVAEKKNKIFQYYDLSIVKAVPIGSILGQEAKMKSHEREKFLCPLHKEKTPSFVWFKEKNNFKCFGCGEYGDSISLYQKIHGTTFIEAVTALQEYI